MNIHVEIFVRTYALISFGVNVMGHILGICLTFLKNYQTVFHSTCTTLHSQCLHIPGNATLDTVSLFKFSHSNRHLVLSHCGFNWCFPND